MRFVALQFRAQRLDLSVTSITAGATNPFNGINLDSFDAGAALFAGEFGATGV